MINNTWPHMTLTKYIATQYISYNNQFVHINIIYRNAIIICRTINNDGSNRLQELNKNCT